MSTYISVIFSKGAHGTHMTKYRVGVQTNGRTKWYRAKPDKMKEVGKNLFDLGITNWIYNQSVNDFEKLYNIKVKESIYQGYEEQKKTKRTPKETCIEKIFAFCDKREFLEVLTPEEHSVYQVLKTCI